MSCKFYDDCDFCRYRKDCPVDLMRTGGPFCDLFLCDAPECNQMECISDDEIADAFGIFY